MVLGFAEMLEDDRPPEDIWLDDPALMEHFERRRATRESERASQGGEPVEDAEMMNNELADEMLREVGLL